MDNMKQPVNNQQSSQIPDLETNPSQLVDVMPAKKKSKKILYVVIGLIIFSLALVGGLFGWYQLQLQPVNGQEIAVEFTVEPGTGAVTISDNLESKELIRSSTAFQFYLKQRSDSANLRTGTYLLSPSLSASEIADVLVDGKVAQRLVTIAPGLHLGKLKDSLVTQGFKEEDIEKALVRKDLLVDVKPPDASLEGYLFPESYSLPLNASVDDLVERAADEFAKNLSDELKTSLINRNISVADAVILASIIQGETDNANEQKNVAEVFLNRLEVDMPLGADPTFRYAAYVEGLPESPSIDSPYNTRINRGLPPGPISNFKITALEAVANPGDHDYMFFVTGDDGKFHYSKTLEEHEEKVDKYCIELCKL